MRQTSSLLVVRSPEPDSAVEQKKALDAEHAIDSNTSFEKQKQTKMLEAPEINTLSVKIMQQQDTWDTDFMLNAREPYEFETDLFKGKILMIVRPPNLDDDPYWSKRIFKEKKRRVIFNVQGKFKRKPNGPLYVGGEITSPMNLSFFTRGILGMLIKLLENGFSGLRYSFGDEKKNLAPRAVVPAHSAFERLVVTPPGTDPPLLSGEPFQESETDRNNRITSKDWKWNTSDTYSFSFYSMYMSLSHWKLVNLPVSPDINLRRLWNDGDLRLVMYEKNGEEKDHSPSSIQYGFNVNIRYLGDQRVSEEESSATESEEDL